MTVLFAETPVSELDEQPWVIVFTSGPPGWHGQYLKLVGEEFLESTPTLAEALRFPGEASARRYWQYVPLAGLLRVRFVPVAP